MFEEIGKNYKVIDGFPEYAVTDDGEVWSYKNKFKSRHGLRKLRPRANKGGYLYVDCVDGCKHQRFAIHRLVAEYFCDGYFDGAVVNHIDANKTNNHYTNLEWVSQKENVNKSYITSGMNQIRNYCIYQIEMPNGDLSPELKTGKKVEEYIIANHLDVKPSMLLKHRYVKGYTLHKISNN
jgi:hypothetical protein